jgi:hypothetical protein
MANNLLPHGAYAYCAYAIESRTVANQCEAWYEIYTPDHAVLLVRTKLFERDERRVFLFGLASDAEEAAAIEARWEIDHMIGGMSQPEPPGTWRRTWWTRDSWRESRSRGSST